MKPLRDNISQRGFIIAEFGFMAVVVLVLAVGKADIDEEARATLGWVAIAGIIAVILACWMNLLIAIVPDMINKLKRKCSNKAKQESEKENAKIKGKTNKERILGV